MRISDQESMILTIGIVIIFGLSTAARGAFEDLPVGGRSIGMGSAYVALAQGPEGVFFNPAGVAQSDKPALCLFIVRPFGLRELSRETVSSMYKTRFGGISVNFQTFGNSQYRENCFSIGWGNRWQNRLFYGLLVKLASLQIDRYGSSSTLMSDIGLLYKMNDRISWGVSMTNLNQGRIGHLNDPLPQVTRVGLCYFPVQGLLFSVELDKDIRFPAELRGGIEICPLPALLLRCGLNRNPSSISFGIGFAWSLFSFDYAFTVHPVLGATHQGSISIDWNLKHGKPLRIKT
jgi:hypothetical protein